MVAVNTNVFVAPTAGQNVAYQIQINGLIAGTGVLRPALIIGSLLFDGSVGNPDVRLKNVTLYEVQPSDGPIGANIAFLKAALPAVYPDVTAALQVLPSGEITLEGTAIGAYNEWMSAMVLTVGPEVILPAVTPTFDPFSLVPGVPDGPVVRRPTLKTLTIDVPPLSTVTVLPAPDPGFVRVTGSIISGPGLGMFFSSYPIGGSANYVLSLIDTIFLGTPLLSASAEIVDATTLAGVMPLRIVFGPLETLEVQNLDAVRTIRVTTGYIDVPDTGISLIRQATNGTTPVTIVPAPTDPTKLRVPFWPEVFPNTLALPFAGSSAAAYWIQRDSVPHVAGIKQSGQFYTGTSAGAAPDTIKGLFLLPVLPFTGGLALELIEATVTDEGLIIGAYQDVDA